MIRKWEFHSHFLFYHQESNPLFKKVIFYLMNFLETALLNIGLSWTASKILPYVISLFAGFLIFLFIRKQLKKWRFNRLIAAILVMLPFLTYFFVYPIYEGDFSNFSEQSKTIEALKDRQNQLLVVAIPGCHYCFESIERLKIIKSRNPEIMITFLVCTQNETDLKDYRREANNSFEIEKIDPNAEMARFVKNKFPTFVVLLENGKSRIWNNSGFGVPAIDEIEDFLRI